MTIYNNGNNDEWRSFSTEELRHWLTTTNTEEIERLYEQSSKVAIASFGRTIFLRGLIEISNYCRNNCLYCGIRKGNHEVDRYRLSIDDILSCCAEGYSLGLRTFVLQGGEDPYYTREQLVTIIQAIRTTYSDCAITLSLGEWDTDDYKAFRSAGANRYLLRHETINDELYKKLHPNNMKLSHRIDCLNNLKNHKFQTGTGLMVGAPHQTIDDLILDLQFIYQLQPEMIGIGPFLAHHATPFADKANGSLDLTLRLIALLRIMHPHALIPSTTALATLSTRGRLLGIKVGANVVMPNLSPMTNRANYSLYDNKAFLGSESAQSIDLLSKELATIGYSINYDRGDHPNISQ